MPDSKQLEFINKAYRFNSGIENKVVGDAHPYFKGAFDKNAPNLEHRLNILLHAKVAEEYVPFGNVLLSNCIDFRDTENYLDELNVLREYQKYIKKTCKMLSYHDYQVEGYSNPDFQCEQNIIELKTIRKNNAESFMDNAFAKSKKQGANQILIRIIPAQVSKRSIRNLAKYKKRNNPQIEHFIILKNGKFSR